MQGGDEAREGAPHDVAESLISSRLQATHLDGDGRSDGAFDAGLSEEAAAVLRQRIDERLRQAADGARKSCADDVYKARLSRNVVR